MGNLYLSFLQLFENADAPYNIKSHLGQVDTDDLLQTSVKMTGKYTKTNNERKKE